MLHDEAMVTLECLANAKQLCILDDKYIVVPHEYGVWKIDHSILDSLANKGWIELTDKNELIVTEKGLYWLKKWDRKNEKNILQRLQAIIKAGGVQALPQRPKSPFPDRDERGEGGYGLSEDSQEGNSGQDQGVRD